MINKNKGEWSELYALLRLLDQGRIYASDGSLNRVDSIYFPIIKILRDESAEKNIEYIVDETNKSINICYNGSYLKTLPQTVFRQEADELLKAISIGGSRAFSIEKTEQFMKEICCDKVVAPSSDKTDITMQVKDVQTGFSPYCGFSIKSELGSAPTLLNASGATNFVYTLNNIDQSDADYVNGIIDGNKIQKRMQFLFEHSTVDFLQADNENLKNNLMLIDSRMSDIIAEALKIHFRDGITKCSDVIGRLEYDNPLGFPNGGYYEFKFKKFLCAVALGMKPSFKWDGKEEANGGYVVITKKGEVLAFHIYNRDFFEDYLLKNTKFERASTSRHGYAHVYSENGEFRIKLNLQIRFI